MMAMSSAADTTISAAAMMMSGGSSSNGNSVLLTNIKNNWVSVGSVNSGNYCFHQQQQKLQC
jgi:hypothetical protein